MDWLNLHTSTLDSAEFIGAKPAQRSTWLCLLRYCAGQENGGTIEACADWSDRLWQQLCKITKREVSESCKLWSWADDALTVWAYPIEKENVVRAKRTYGQLGGRPKANHKDNHQVKQDETTRFDSAETEGKGKEGEGNRKGKGRVKPASGDAAPALGRPADLEETVTYFASKDAPASEAEAFFDHYEANGWRQGGRTVIRSWHSAANGWIRRWRDGGMGGGKIARPGGGAPRGPVVPFNPDQPHAHTGGLPDAAALADDEGGVA